MSRRTDPVSFRLPPAVKKAAERAAEDDSRSLSSLLEKVLIDYLREHGYLTAKRRGHTVPPSTRGG